MSKANVGLVTSMSISISFLICKMGILTVLPSEDCWDNLRPHVKHLAESLALHLAESLAL